MWYFFSESSPPPCSHEDLSDNFRGQYRKYTNEKVELHTILLSLCVECWFSRDSRTRFHPVNKVIWTLLCFIRLIFPNGLPVKYSIVTIMRVRRTTKKDRWYLWQIFDQSGTSQVGESSFYISIALKYSFGDEVQSLVLRQCLDQADIDRGWRRQEDHGVFLPGSAEEHSPLHVQEPRPARPFRPPVAQAERFCAEQHCLHLHGLQAYREETDWRERRRGPRRAHGHHHASGERTARRRMVFSLTYRLIYVFHMRYLVICQVSMRIMP